MLQDQALTLFLKTFFLHNLLLLLDNEVLSFLEYIFEALV